MKTAQRVIALVVGVVLILVVFHTARYHRIDRDEAQAAELAQSVGSAFCYCTSGIPRAVYPVSFSTNGPLVYVAAFFFALSHGNPDIALVGVSVLGTALIAGALFALEPWLVVIALLIYLGWPAAHYLATSFLGEMWSIGLSLSGIVFFRRLELGKHGFRSLVTWNFALACICFGLAMETKLISTASIVTIVYALSYQALPSSSLRERVLNLLRAALVCVLTAAGSVVYLFVSIALSVAHSVRNPFDFSDMLQAPLGFVANMILQGTTKSEPDYLGHFAIRVHQFSHPLILVFVLAAAIVLIVRNWTYLPFVGVSLVAWLKVGDNEDHIVIAFYLMLVLGALESQALLRRLIDGPRQRWVAQLIVAVLALSLYVIIVPPASIAIETPSGPVPSFESRRYVQTSVGMFHYSQGLVDVIRRQTYVATSGFWYFPEMVIREGFHFYDRTAPAAIALPKDKVALLFDRGNTAAPPTSVKDNCGSIIYEDGPIVLCNVKRSRQTDFQLHVPTHVSTPTTGPNLLVSPLFSDGYHATATPTGTMGVVIDSRSDEVRVSLNGASGSTELFHGVRVQPGATVIVSGILTVSGAALPRLAGADVLYIDGADGPIGGEGVDSSNDPGDYPFAFPVTPRHPNGKALFFIHVETARNRSTTIGLRNLTVAAVKELTP